MKFNFRRNLYYKSSSCSKISVYPTPSHLAVFPYRCYHFLAAGAGRPEHVVYEASKMLLTSNAVDVDEGDYIDDGRPILPLFSFWRWDRVFQFISSPQLHQVCR
jgi:hypothetical protein